LNQESPVISQPGDSEKGPASQPDSGIGESSSQIKTGYCEGKAGILMIQGGDAEAAVGTLFFMYVVNHLIYADQNNLVPWIHLNSVFPCYDAIVHGNETKTFTMMGGVTESKIVGKDAMECKYWKRPQLYPGPIKVNRHLTPQNFTIKGNGLWPSYFEPLSGYPPDDPSCQDTPLFSLHTRSIFPGMHICAPWAVRPWSFNHVPTALRPEGTGQPVHEWLGPMRERGAEKVSKYFRPLPRIQELIEQANPAPKCLSMHIRLTDKSNGRQKKPLDLFQAYAEAYTQASGGGGIFIATDDSTILETIRKNWTITKMHHQQNILRSSGSDAIFRTFQNETHRTNMEGIIDMYAMSRCDFFVHGFSAMAEAAVYLNPALHNRSVNVDVKFKELIKARQFQDRVKEYYKSQ
jgi:hypothetical protein